MLSTNRRSNGVMRAFCIAFDDLTEGSPLSPRAGQTCWLAVLTVLLMALSISHALAQAQNSTCSNGSSSSTKVCNDVTTGGISFGQGISSILVSDDPSSPVVSINGNVVGIELSVEGGSGATGASTPTTFPTVTVQTAGADTPNDSGDDEFKQALDDGSGTPAKDDQNNTIFVVVDNGSGQQTFVDDTGASIPDSRLTGYLSSFVEATAGSAGGAVSIGNSANFTTQNADGIIGRSTGGRGGNGGVINILFIAEFGQDGKSGENGGSVAITNSGDVTVNGSTANQYGIHALSQGGQGGNGGGFFAAFSKPGDGGNGGNGSAVSVTNLSTSTITTSNQGGHGIYAKSAGGNGGSGGSTVAGLALGSGGGNGGDGGRVTINNAGTISTSGNFAHGIYGLSLGAGAGSGSSVGGLIALGGRGGNEADGDTVTISNTGTLSTTGNQAYAILAQSIGGGGGDGGSAGGILAVGGRAGSGGDAGDVTVCQGATYNSSTNTCSNPVAGSTITTSGEKSSAIVAQAIGGGGGNGGDAISVGPSVAVSVGGDGGNGGRGGKVAVTAHGTITTTGAGEAHGILAQSIGGGGGNGGKAIAASVGVTFVSASVAVGGTGGGGNAADKVNVTSDANITTSGDRASAIAAQSIGGGGGNGGLAVAGSLRTVGGTVSVGVGGSGGSGGNGDTVTVTTEGGALQTSGANAHGIFAQSVGGGGGSGGLAVAASIGASGSINVGLGGKGAAGGNASTVTVDNAATIGTSGIGSYGLYAQSIGGGGGDGGMVVAAGLSPTATVSVGLGGTGGGGGVGGLVDVDNTGAITTKADQATAVLAQSVGGGGGAGGNALTFSGASGVVAGAVTVGLGGAGADGGQGGDVQLDNTNAAITTSGANATALLAQSIGGGGGTGGYAVAGSLAVSKDGSAAVAVALGGAGGAGGQSGKVTVNNSGQIVTGADAATGKISDGSSGIVAQSVAGGGGAGGTSVAGALSFSKGGAGAVSVSLGGSGGSGGVADIVTVDNDGAISTQGADSFGILAQSIGGAGGVGGLSVGAALSGSGSGSGSIAVALGGSGGAGSEGHAVMVDNSNIILTTGARSVGIAAQSIGGAGGAGGTSVAGTLNFSKESGAAVSVGLGGLGGDGGSAGRVDVDNTGGIWTEGADAAGILAQSIGGQGGLGGLNVSGAINATGGAGGAINVGLGGAGGAGGTSGIVDVTNTATIITHGARSGGIVAQSIGGEGGQGGMSIGFAAGVSKEQAGAVSVSLGGSGGGGGTANDVIVTNSGAIRTSGGSNTNADGERVNTDAHAILAQSIGGSGGYGGIGGSAAVAIGKQATAAASVGVGGFGGAGGTAGNVTVNNSNTLWVSSDNSMGLVAQSIGGSGGAGGAAVSLSFGLSTSSNAGSASAAVGGGGGAGVASGNVTVTNTGDIFTEGASGFGMLAQSIGGDGGQGGFTVSATGAVTRDIGGSIGLSIGGPGGEGGTAGTVTVGTATDPLNSTIQTLGQNAIGIVAQSIGGGGGTGGFSGSLSGVVNPNGNKRTIGFSLALGGEGGSGGIADAVNVHTATDNHIITQGDFAYGVLGQSIGGKGGVGGGAVGSVINVAGGEGNTSVNASLAVGGFGGDGARGGTVMIENDGSITTGASASAAAIYQGLAATPTGTDGQFAHGIFAQSIGGDGGAGGFTGSIQFVKGSGTQSGSSYNLSATVGGFGGDGAVSGAVDVSNSGMITTFGERAVGIFAQSVGGGGGAGGTAGLDDDFWGENIILDTAIAKVVTGNADTIEAQGGSYAGSFGANIHTMSVSVGGFGGSGGDSNDVTVVNEADGVIVTYGFKSHGILAQSVGGGGGQGGISTAASTAVVASNNASLSFAVGGFGGFGGDGKAVDVTNDGYILTTGGGAIGIYAQSIGGGGGDGGDTRGFTLQRQNKGLGDDLKAGKQLTVTVGGFGRSGGVGGSVDVTNTGTIQTVGTGAYGVYAQSVGGGGGRGGNSSVSSKELGVFFEDDKTVKKNFRSQKYKLALGGFGGSGGKGGTVTVNNSGTIETFGQMATAIYAQSVGGGGGEGGKASTGFTGDFSIGGFGGTGNNGGQVLVGNTSSIITRDLLSDGIFAQSVGGGGGDGGAADFGDARTARGEIFKAIRRKGFKEGLKDLAKKTFLPGFGIGVGGFGGSAGDGNAVTVCNGALVDASTGQCGASVAAADIVTTGTSSHGIFAQSVGGGGGVGGAAYLTNVGKIGIGGLGGAAGDGGAVNVVNNGDITTLGEGSFGIFAQSVGGGGGLAGDITFGIEGVGADASKIIRHLKTGGLEDINFDADENDEISEKDKALTKLYSGLSLTPAEIATLDPLDPEIDANQNGIADEAEDPNDPNKLAEGFDIDQNGLPVSDEDAAALAALYDGSSGTSSDPTDPNNVLYAATSAAMQDSVGDGLAETWSGDAATAALLAGLTGSELVEFLKTAFSSDGTSITFKSSVIDLLNGVSGDGGEVTVNMTGTITTTGGMSDDEEERAGSIGIFAQSVGGGGGVVSQTVTVTEAEIDTDLNLDGDKDDAFEISSGQGFAGTVGGKGRGGKVTVNHSGSIYAPNWNGFGIFAQSVGGDLSQSASGGDDITINVDGGVIQGGDGDDENLAAAIFVDGGLNNQINVGSDSEIFAVSERALIAGLGNETVTSAGSVVGNVDLGLGTNTYVNQTSGYFETRETINLNGGDLTNSGIVNLGGTDEINATTLTGNYAQDTDGSYAVDLNFGVKVSDLMNVAGTAELAGMVTPKLQSLARLAPPETVLSSAGTLTNSGIDVEDTLIVDYDPVFSGQNFQIGINSIDFSPQGLTRNQTAAGDFINTILYGDGSEPLGTFFAAIANLNDVNEVATILEQIHPEAYAAKLAPTLFASQQFGNDLQSCPVAGRDTGAINREGQCVWARFTGTQLTKDRDGNEFSATRETSYSFAGGAQLRIAPNVHFGGGISHSSTTFDIGNLAVAEGDRLQLGGVLKYENGPWLFSAGASGGHSFNDTTRAVNLTSVVPYAGTATADDEISHANLQLRAAHTFTMGQLYARPSLDLNAFYLYQNATKETGAGPLNLRLSDAGEWVFGVTPSLELGTQFVDAPTGLIFRPYVKAGLTHFSKNELGVSASFEGAPLSAGDFEAVSDLDKTVGNVTMGLDVLDVNDQFDLKFRYDGRFGSDNFESHSGSVKVGVRF